MPQVQVTENPVAVVLIVGLIAAATVLAVLFAGPWSVRVPRPPVVAEREQPAQVPTATVEPTSQPSAPPSAPPQAPVESVPATPWSTSDPTGPPWASPGRPPHEHD